MQNYAILEPTDVQNKYRVINIIVADSTFVFPSTHVPYDDTNPAVIGGFYDGNHKKFYSMAPYDTWKLNKVTWQWEAPVPEPKDGKQHYWDDITDSWKVIPDVVTT